MQQRSDGHRDRQRLPDAWHGADVKAVAPTPRPISTAVGLTLTADAGLEDVRGAGQHRRAGRAGQCVRALAAMEAGDDEAPATQLLIEHDPQPPTASESFAGAVPDIREPARAQSTREPETTA
jgi:hypothetical protein